MYERHFTCNKTVGPAINIELNAKKYWKSLKVKVFLVKLLLFISQKSSISKTTMVTSTKQRSLK